MITVNTGLCGNCINHNGYVGLKENKGQKGIRENEQGINGSIGYFGEGERNQ